MDRGGGKQGSSGDTLMRGLSQTPHVHLLFLSLTEADSVTREKPERLNMTVESAEVSGTVSVLCRTEQKNACLHLHETAWLGPLRRVVRLQIESKCHWPVWAWWQHWAELSYTRLLHSSCGKRFFIKHLSGTEHNSHCICGQLGCCISVYITCLQEVFTDTYKPS